MKLDWNSKIKEVYQNPIGHDILAKLMLQMNKKESLLLNPVVGNLKLKTIAAFTSKILGKDFFETLLILLNTETDIPESNQGEIIQKWWKEAVFYQIYPRSFQDSDGDGIGDLGGIITRLDYLKELGIDAIWLSPIYDSPNDDNGYDIREYYSIMKEFGTMEDFDRLLLEVHNRGMKLIMDLVVNHTSDEHAWFQAAINNIDSEFEDYYLFQKSEKETPPNNWTSFFSGGAWNYYENKKLWGLHLFSKKQMDLNWENEAVRDEIQKMIRWWLTKGVDGFRLDVINYISKREGLPMGNENLGKLMGYYGIEHYYYGPKLHQYLKELKVKAFEPFDAFTVGETPGVGREMAKLLTADYRRELDMIFSFDHLETPGHKRFDSYRYDLNYFKEYISNWTEYYTNHCWMTLFFENHDNPRMISKIDPTPEYREVLAKLLAMLQLTMKGTPFLYQGQEIGSVNHSFTSITEMRDVESVNLYDKLLPTLGAEAALNKVISGSRDHSRTPMKWNGGKNAGFTEGEPWIGVTDDYKDWNVESQLEQPNSIYHFYQRLIGLRKNYPALVYGDYRLEHRKERDLFTYYRKLGEVSLYVECNLSNRIIVSRPPSKGERILSNYPDKLGKLRPYEANLYLS